MKISAIISDYDGTLCPTSSLYSNNQIPQDIYNILFDISKCIPICIVSSKDFYHLQSCVGFAKIISSIMGIETFFLQKIDEHSKLQFGFSEEPLNQVEFKNNFTSNGYFKYYSIDKQILKENSFILDNLSSVITKNFEDIIVIHKYTYNDKILAGLCFDYRHLSKWENYKLNIEPRLKDKISEYVKIKCSSSSDLHVQTYSTHPFLDVYSLNLNKGDVILFIRQLLKLGNDKKILYLGDSENDNPAFRKADLAINIKSDGRINTKLHSHYSLEFNELSYFLTALHKRDFNFNSMSILN